MDVGKTKQTARLFTSVVMNRPFYQTRREPTAIFTAVRNFHLQLHYKNKYPIKKSKCGDHRTLPVVGRLVIGGHARVAESNHQKRKKAQNSRHHEKQRHTGIGRVEGCVAIQPQRKHKRGVRHGKRNGRHKVEPEELGIATSAQTKRDKTTSATTKQIMDN